MTGLHSRKELLVVSVLKHMPSSKNPHEFGERRADRYASDIAYADRDREQIFDQSVDAVAIEKLRKHLTLANRALSGLTPGTHSWLNCMIGGGVLRRPNSDAASDFSESLDLITRRLAAMQAVGPFAEKASAKRNWHAVAVTHNCREAWGQEAWIAKNGLPPPIQSVEYETFLDEADALAPSTQHHLRPGPFGRFLEDVFAVLEIKGSGGASLSAATALDSLSDLWSR